MPSLTPLGDKLRRLRAAHGYKQLELALKAGVSERTVRAAEKSQPIRQELLECLAIALGVSLGDVSETSSELADLLRWRKNCATFARCAQQSMFEHDPRSLMEITHPDFELFYFGSMPGVESIRHLLGEYRGKDGVQRFVENTARFWELAESGVVALDPPQGTGDTVQLRGYHELRRQDGEVTWGRFTVIADFEAGRLRTLQGMMVPGGPPPNHGVLTKPASE